MISLFMLSTHLFTCFWISLGLYDIDNYQELNDNNRPISWIFVEGSDFSKDPRSIYDQINDSDSLSISGLYLYSLYFILTVVTTVGFGAHTYTCSREYIYVIFLELISTLIQGTLIIALREYSHYENQDFHHIIENRMESLDAWLVFKI